MNRSIPIAALLALSLLGFRSEVEKAARIAPDRPLASLLPPSCLVYLEGCGLQPLLEQGLDHPFVRALGQTPIGEELRTRLPRSPEEAIRLADAWLGQPALPLIAGLTRHGIGLGFSPGTKEAVLVARGGNADEVSRDLAFILDAIERRIGAPGLLDRPGRHWEGADIWTLGEMSVARRGELLVVGNGVGPIEEVLELAADPSGRGLLDREGFEELRTTASSDATLWVWIDMAGIAPFADTGFRELRTADRKPAVQGLLGAQVGAALSARALSVGLSLEHAETVELEIRAFEGSAAAALVPLARTGCIPAACEGPDLASALVYRDYARFLTLRQELFAPEALPSFAEALTNAALFFGGQDLGEEVLAGLSPWIRVVVRSPRFESGRVPEAPLPAAAAVACLEDERDGEQWVAAFQTVVSILNVDQTQKGKKSLHLALEREGEVSLSVARYSTPASSEEVDLRYNLEPSLAVVGRHLVIGTHSSLVHDLVRRLAEATPTDSSLAAETLEIEASGWRSLLDANFELLVARKVLEEGLELEVARGKLEPLRQLLRTLEGMRAVLSSSTPGSPVLRVELRLAPSGPR